MTDTTVTAARAALGLTEESRQEGEERAARERAMQAEADEHAAELERLRGERAAVEQQDQQRARSQLANVMREVREQIQGARAAAMQAVRDGTDPVGAWVRYRLTASDARGRWEGFTTAFEAATGLSAPPGPNFPPLEKEGLSEFLVFILRDGERQARQAANMAMRDELNTDRIVEERRQRRRTEKAAERAARAAMEAKGKEVPPEPSADHRTWAIYASRVTGMQAMAFDGVSRDELAERYGLMSDPDARRAADEVLSAPESLQPTRPELRTVTPAMASWWLAQNPQETDRDKVAQFAEDMAAGKWRKRRAEPIRGVDGLAVDGHHRLAALVQAGRPVELYVRDLPEPTPPPAA